MFLFLWVMSSFLWPKPLLLSSTQQHIIIIFSSQSSEHACSDEFKRDFFFFFSREVGIKSERKREACLNGPLVLCYLKEVSRQLNFYPMATALMGFKKIIITSRMALKEMISILLCIINPSLKCDRCFCLTWLGLSF